MSKFKTAIFAVSLLLPFQVQAQTACETYTVAPGDTLRLIAEHVFGSRDLSPVIYNANRSVVGDNPNNIEIGMRLTIPCDQSSGSVRVVTEANAVVVEAPVTETQASAPVVEVNSNLDATNSDDQTETPEDTPKDVVQSVTQPRSNFPETPSYISVGIFPPFSDGDGKGLMTDIIRASLSTADSLRDVNVNAVSLPFDPLMASMDPDVILSFPWIDPDCESGIGLSERSVMLCENYEFSDKAYEIVMTFFVADRSGLAQVTDPAQFGGKRICVPEQYPTNHLVEAGFLQTDVLIERGNSVAECMSKLLSGQTDVVNADYLSVESIYAVLSSQSIIVENPSFTWIRSVHAIANKNNEPALQTLFVFNSGLARIKNSGEWTAIVQQYLN